MSRKIYTYSLICLLGLLLSSCHMNKKKESSDVSSSYIKKDLKYAKGFELFTSENDKVLRVYDSKSVDSTYQDFKLVAKKTAANEIQVPCKKIICLSSTQLTYFFALNDIDPIVATNSSRHLFHKGLNEKIEKGEIKRVGKEGHFNTELIAGINPDLIFVSPYKAGGFDALKNLGIPLVPMAAYDEKSPLGRAEWVKMIAPFIGKEKQADSLFQKIAIRYDSLKNLTQTVKKRPTVFSGKMRSGIWYVPGGKSFFANYFRDAGAKYIIDDDKQGAYPLDFETMYTKAAACDYWRILVPEPIGFGRKALFEQDDRYADFKAYKTGHVIMCNIREKPYYEQNAMKPDVILADYIHCFHPNLLPNYQPVFYEALQ
ncbi:ABC transporter substrate-binding protein [Ancylomarina sp. 16SWW S1-10-2]|uniref:ABC transporter substrate-binding protein n=1 Tax=Ancylomarina sp. 16SWW S1-10-2 TaxID=2499681 RepID=UPI0012AE6D9F|nr:ABC transporter substrate-binding protein [Ancylomarina sp. 16SWW S1-10-2]MRT94633.1 iron ABC transporter substrate-binding protein [Ancylomarina sp. 16SWW S1-10-2]